MKFHVYVLRSLKDGTYYTGSTSNLDKRLEEHNSGKTKSTKSKIPYKLVYKEECSSRAEAMRREKFFKSGKGREYLKQILKEA